MDVRIFLLISGFAGVLGIGIGVVMLLAPARALQEGARLRRWLFEVDLVGLLDRRRTIERPLYRHHYAFGAAVLGGAVALSGALWEVRDQALVMSVLREVLGARGAEAVIATSGALAIFAFAIGVFMVLRPSALKGFEAAANRWIELFPSAAGRGAPATGISIIPLVMRAPRLTALALLTTGIACLSTFATS